MATQDYALAKTILSDKGYSWTKPRELVFRSLKNGRPVPISYVIKRLNGRVDRVSVYRIIELYEKLGVVHRVNVGWKYKLELSDQFVAHHHHLNCLGCGQVIDIEDEQHINSFISSIADKFNFEPSRHQFEIEGLCEACRAKQRPVSV